MPAGRRAVTASDPPSPDRTNRWGTVTGIPVEASFLRAFETFGGPVQLGYPISQGLMAGDTLLQYFNHARLEAPGRLSPHPVGVPRVADLGTAMARGVGGGDPAPLESGPSGAFADPWHDPDRQARAGRPVAPAVRWRGSLTQWHEREIVRLMPVSPQWSRPVAGNLGDLFVSLTEEQRVRGDRRESPVARPEVDSPGPVVAPILTYHRARGTEPFRAQLEGLIADGFEPISLDHLVAAVEGWATAPPRPVVIAFDDGWRDQLDGAVPVLIAMRVPATFFVLPGFDRFEQGHMTESDFEQIRASGFTVASHTLNHAQLPELIASNIGAARAEVVESRDVLEDRVDGVDYFAYPNGRFDDAATELVRAAGYRAAVTTVNGIVHTRDRLFELRRVRLQAWWPYADVRTAIRSAAAADGVESPV